MYTQGPSYINLVDTASEHKKTHKINNFQKCPNTTAAICLFLTCENRLSLLCTVCSITCSVRAPLTKSYNSAGRGGGCIVPSPCSFQTFVPLVNLYMLLLSCFCGLFPPSFSCHTRSFSVTFSSFLIFSYLPFLRDFLLTPSLFIFAYSPFHIRIFALFSGPNLHSPSFILALSSDLILIPLFSYSPFYYFLSLSNSSIPWTLLLHIPYCSSSPFLLNSLTSFSFTCPFT